MIDPEGLHSDWKYEVSNDDTQLGFQEWVDRHSVTCHYCGELADERETIRLEEGEAHEECYKAHKTMTQHTPGPWDWQEWDDGTIAIEAYNSGKDVIARHLEITPADARLIAAAPDLLEALLAVMREYEPPDDCDLDCLVLARAAIAKAGG